MSRRRTKIELHKIVATLRDDLSAEIQTTIARELSRLELAAAVSTPTSTNSQAPAPAPTTTEKGDGDQAGHITITQETGRAIYRVIESVEDLVHLEQQGRRRSFEKKAVEIESLIAEIDTEMLGKIDLSHDMN